VAALLAFDYEADLETNAQSMKEAQSEVRSVEVTRAVRDTKLGRLDIKKNQAIGFLDGDLVSVADKTEEALTEAMEKVEPDKAEVVTIYYGADTKQSEAEKVAAAVRERYPQLQVEVVHGGQPHYNYIASVE
jgi:dihydroxyacetone kinase-like predicted kinase